MKKFNFFIFFLISFFIFSPLDSHALNIYFYGNNYSNLGKCSDLNWCVPNDPNTANIIAIRVEDTDYQIIADSKYQANQTFKIWNRANNFSIRDDVVFYAGAIRPNTITYNAKNSSSYDDFGQTYIVNYGVANEFTAVAASTGYFYEYYFPSAMQISRFEIAQWDIINTGSTTGDIINNSTNTIINNNKENTQNIIDNENKNHEEAEESRKGIWDSILELPQKIGNLLKDLFIPDDGYFEDQFNVLKDNITDVLGFLAFPFVLVIDTFEFFLTIEDTGSYVIRWPDIPVPNFENHNIINAGQFDFADLLQNPVINGLRNLSLVFINVYILLAFLQLCHNKYTRVFGGDTSEIEFISVSDEYDVDYSTGEVTGMKHIEKKTRRRDVN